MLGTKRFERTIIGADIIRLLSQADDPREVLQLFDDYTHHVPADIAAEVRAVLEWTPWTHRPPVHVTRDEVPDNCSSRSAKPRNVIDTNADMAPAPHQADTCRRLM